MRLFTRVSASRTIAVFPGSRYRRSGSDRVSSLVVATCSFARSFNNEKVSHVKPFRELSWLRKTLQLACDTVSRACTLKSIHVR